MIILQLMLIYIQNNMVMIKLNLLFIIIRILQHSNLRIIFHMKIDK